MTDINITVKEYFIDNIYKFIKIIPPVFLISIISIQVLNKIIPKFN
jgi:hypothetical protein